MKVLYVVGDVEDVRDAVAGEAVEVGVVDVGSRSEQLPHARRMVVPHSVQQGRHASGDELLLCEAPHSSAERLEGFT